MPRFRLQCFIWGNVKTVQLFSGRGQGASVLPEAHPESELEPHPSFPEPEVRRQPGRQADAKVPVATQPQTGFWLNPLKHLLGCCRFLMLAAGSSEPIQSFFCLLNHIFIFLLLLF